MSWKLRTSGRFSPQGVLELAVLAALWDGKRMGWRFCGGWRAIRI